MIPRRLMRSKKRLGSDSEVLGEDSYEAFDPLFEATTIDDPVLIKHPEQQIPDESKPMSMETEMAKIENRIN